MRKGRMRKKKKQEGGREEALSEGRVLQLTPAGVKVPFLKEGRWEKSWTKPLDTKGRGGGWILESALH